MVFRSLKGPRAHAVTNLGLLPFISFSLALLSQTGSVQPGVRERPRTLAICGVTQGLEPQKSWDTQEHLPER